MKDEVEQQAKELNETKVERNRFEDIFGHLRETTLIENFNRTLFF